MGVVRLGSVLAGPAPDRERVSALAEAFAEGAAVPAVLVLVWADGLARAVGGRHRVAAWREVFDLASELDDDDSICVLCDADSLGPYLLAAGEDYAADLLEQLRQGEPVDGDELEALLRPHLPEPFARRLAAGG